MGQQTRKGKRDEELIRVSWVSHGLVEPPGDMNRNHRTSSMSGQVNGRLIIQVISEPPSEFGRQLREESMTLRLL